MKHIPPAAKVSPCDDSLIILKYFSAYRKMQTYVEYLLFHPCNSKCLGPSSATTLTQKMCIFWVVFGWSSLFYNYLWPDEFSIWEQSIEKGELSCLRENSLNNACLKHCLLRLWTASWCNFISFIDICKARGVLSTLFWYSYEYSCLHVDILSAMDTLLVKEKSTKSVQNALEILQGMGKNTLCLVQAATCCE